MSVTVPVSVSAYWKVTFVALPPTPLLVTFAMSWKVPPICVIVALGDCKVTAADADTNGTAINASMKASDSTSVFFIRNSPLKSSGQSFDHVADRGHVV